MARRQVVRKQGIPSWVWVAVAGGLLFVGFAGFLVVTAMANAGKPTPEQQRIASLPTPEEFEEKLVGKHENDVLKLMGKPSTTAKDHWIYDDVARDRITGQLKWISLHFNNQIVTAVGY